MKASVIMENEITGGFTFYGYIPDNSNKQHLGIVLGVNDPALKYCYCTSKYKKIINEMDFIKIPAEKMQIYFNDAKETYIYISILYFLAYRFFPRLAGFIMQLDYFFIWYIIRVNKAYQRASVSKQRETHKQERMNNFYRITLSFKTTTPRFKSSSSSFFHGS